MKIGLTLPQGCDREFVGIPPRRAWARTIEIAERAESLGFESLWVYDHFQVDPPPEEAPIFEPFVELTAVAGATSRARLGHLVLAAAYRNPALTAKMISTLDVASGGRAELGIGAGWKEDEWLAYGYGFPAAPERLAILADHLEVITRMLAPGRATFEGRHAHVRDAIHEPKGLQLPRIPIVVGGNGPRVTWRLAARFADELNLDALPPEEVDRALPVIAERCVEIDREPSSLRVSIHVWGSADTRPGRERRDRLRQYDELGLSRAILQGFPAVRDDAVLDSLAEDCAALGLLAPTAAPPTPAGPTSAAPTTTARQGAPRAGG
ncbi:MAG: TIGR03560 family F420-dependent LLM class oxidoreductase [Chloroflexota bacterium]|nr:TIGR03560 family F420-dependent LLM class oxidoreductase [Chloroflexota bacterium]